MKKTIAVDARPLSSSTTGISRIISKVIENINDTFTFHLFSHLPVHEDFRYLLKQENVIWHENTSFLKKGGSWYILHLPLLMKKLKPDIFWGTQQTLPPFLPGTTKKILTVLDFVALRYPDSMRKIAYFQQTLLMVGSFRKADYFISISHQTQEELIQFYLRKMKKPASAYKVIHLGFDVPESIKELPFLKEIHPYILAVSTIEPRKNYLTLLEAYYAYFQEEREQPYNLVIVGKKGWETDHFYRRLQELQQKTKSIYIMDTIRDDELYSLYYHSAFFCLPSLYEGFGLPVLEALCFQKPLLLSDIPVFHEIAEGYAVFLPANDTGAWKEKIKEFVTLHRKGKLPPVNFPKEEWSWKRVASSYKEVFSSFA